jgi:hypothetical protein
MTLQKFLQEDNVIFNNNGNAKITINSNMNVSNILEILGINVNEINHLISCKYYNQKIYDEYKWVIYH